MDDLDLAALEALLARATQGPWVVRALENFGFNIVHYIGGDKFSIKRIAKSSLEDDAALIVAVVNALPDLIATIRTQAAELAALKAAPPSVQHVDTMNDRVLMEMARDAALNKGGDRAQS